MTSTADLAVVTVVRGRHDHLERQLWGLRRQTRAVDVHVVVAMDDPRVAAVLAASPPGSSRTLVREIGLRDGALPLAAARNLGAETAVDAGARHLVFLDVDCIPSPRLTERYGEVLHSLAAGDEPAGEPGDGPRDGSRSVTTAPRPHPRVLAGEVAYLPPPPPGADYRDLDLPALGEPHPARPRLRDDEIREADDERLFWSLSFATDAGSWEAVGGFDEDYVGYGGEDTDFGQRVRRVDGRLLWVGGARAFHQHHPTGSPPVQHLADIVTNANRFASRWGWWPMEGWLEAFASRGLARRRPDGSWEATPTLGPRPGPVPRPGTGPGHPRHDRG